MTDYKYTDKDSFLEILKEEGKENPYLLNHASPELKNDADVVWEAVSHNSLALQHASSDILNNKEFMRSIVTIFDGWLIQYASEALRSDKELALQALQNNGRFENLSQSLHGNKEVVLQALTIPENIQTILKDMHGDLFDDPEVMMIALTGDPECLNLPFSDTLKDTRKDEKFFLEAVKINPQILRYADKSIKHNRKVLLEALRTDSLAANYIPTSLKKEFGLCPLNYLESWFRNKKMEKELKDKELHSKKTKI